MFLYVISHTILFEKFTERSPRAKQEERHGSTNSLAVINEKARSINQTTSDAN